MSRSNNKYVRFVPAEHYPTPASEELAEWLSSRREGGGNYYMGPFDTRWYKKRAMRDARRATKAELRKPDVEAINPDPHGTRRMGCRNWWD